MSNLQEKKRDFANLIAQVKSQVERLSSTTIIENYKNQQAEQQQQQQQQQQHTSTTSINNYNNEKEEMEKVKEFVYDSEWTNKKAQLLLGKKLVEQENVRLKSRQEEIKQRVIESNNSVISLKEELRHQQDRIKEVIMEKEALIKEKADIEQTVLLLQIERELLDTQTSNIRDSLQRSQVEVQSLSTQLNTKKESEMVLLTKTTELQNNINQLEEVQSAMQCSLIDHQTNLHNQELELQIKSKTIEALSAKLSRLDQRGLGLVHQLDTQTKEMMSMQDVANKAQIALEAAVKVSQTATQTQKELLDRYVILIVIIKVVVVNVS